MFARSLVRPAWLAAATAFLAAAGAGTATAQGITCEKCHGNRDFLVGKGGPQGDSALYVPAGTLQDTRHASLRCAQCHVGYDAGYPHRATSRVVPCSTCHAAEGRDWDASIHAANSASTGDAPTCVGCHGSHTVYGAADRRSPTHPLNVAMMCGRCHADPRIIGTYFATADKTRARTAVAHFYKTVHGNALTGAGLVVSATCNDCHRAHKVLPADSTGSSVNRANIPATCGACHVGVVEAYDSSAHGAAYRTGGVTTTGHSAPVCVDCHSAHEIVRADQPQWLLGVVQECGTCHERLYETYFETYHGKVTRLGFNLAATCSDCHTAHNMRPASDTRSSVYAENLVATCGRCHSAANANFVRYQPHGDPKDRTKYPLLFWSWLFMTLLLVGTMSFFLLHTFLWLVRITINRLRGGGPAHTEAQP
jgi:hypothetical protein